MAKNKKSLIDAVRRYDDRTYFKTLIRFPADLEDAIRTAAAASGRSLNNFLVTAACQLAGIPEPELKEPGKKSKTTRGSDKILHDMETESTRTTRPSSE